MKKVLLPLALMLSATPAVWANGPYTGSLLSDLYDAAPNGIVTPNSLQDAEGSAGNDLYDVVNAIQGSSFTNNAQLDSYQYLGQDSVWQNLTGPGGDATFTLIGVGAGAYDTLRVYDTANPGTKLNIAEATGFGLTGDGSLLNPFPAFISPLAGGTQFGWNVYSILDSATEWDSDPTKNSDGLDHMITYRLTDLIGKSAYLDLGGEAPVEYTFQDPYLIGFEDLALKDGKLGDEDFNDLVYVVDRVAPVAPEPISTALFLTGGATMAGALIRRRRKTVTA